MSANVIDFPASRHFKSAPATRLKHPSIIEWREVRHIKRSSPDDEHIGFLIAGNSLMGDGILDGDYAICRQVTEIAEIESGCIAAIRTPAGLLLKHVYAGIKTVRLVSSNPEYDELCYRSDEVQVVGVLVRIERDFQ